MKRSMAFLYGTVIIAPAAGFAQTNTDPPATGAAAGGLEEIVVTAQRREQNLLDVPISVAVIGPAQIADSGIKGAADYALMTPNVFFTSEDAQTRNNGDITIRGNSDLTAGTDNRHILSKPVIGLYVDDVAVNDAASGSANPPLGDVERIEILRGPQSMYFGRAAEAGAVNIVTRKPVNEESATFQASVGNFGYRGVGAIVNHVLADDLYFRGSFDWSGDDGYVRNLYPGGPQPDYSARNGKAAFRWKPQNWTIDAAVQISQTEGGPFGGLSTGVQPWGPGQFANGGEFSQLSTCGLGKGFLIHSDGSGNNRYMCQRTPSYTDTSDMISHVNAKYVGDGFTFTSISSNITSTYHQLVSIDNSGGQLFDRKNRYDTNTWEQEFRVASSDERYKLGGVQYDWTLGLYGYDNANHLRDDILTGPGTVPNVLFLVVPGDEPNANSIVSRWHGFAGFLDTTWHFTQALSANAGGRYSMDQNSQTWTDTTSSFLCGSRQVTNGIVPPLQTGCSLLDPGTVPGAIYTDSSGAQWASGGTAIQNLWNHGATRHSNFSPRVSFNFKASEDQSLYLTYSVGYNPGGVVVNTAYATLPQQLGQIPAPDNRTFFQTETTDNLELGWHGYFDDHKLLLSAAVFRENQHHKQFINSYNLCPTATGELVNQSLPASIVPGGPNSCLKANGQPYGGFIPENSVENANLARSQGVEASLVARLGEHFDMQLSGAFLDAKFIDFNNAPAGFGPANGPFTATMNGIELPNSPRWSGSAVFNGHKNIGELEWFGTVGVNYKDIAVTSFSTAYDPQNPHQWPFWAHAVTLVNLDTGVDFSGNRVTLSVQNLFDTFYETGPAGSLSATGATVQLHPRLIQLTWQRKFGGS